METNLRDQVVLITGAAGGIGQATARAFAAEGATVAIHYHTSDEQAGRLARELGDAAMTVQADLRDESQVGAMYESIINQAGRIDVLVVNAGIWREREIPLHDMTLDEWRHTIDSDLTSTFLTCRGFLRHLAEVPREAPSIVLVGSTAALFGEACHADYSAAKAAMVYGLTRSLKNEIVHLAPRGRVNTVCPGWIVTPMTEADLADETLVSHVMSTMAMKKIGRADDVANLVVFLSSDALAGHVTGAIVPIAGGMEGRLLNR